MRRYLLFLDLIFIGTFLVSCATMEERYRWAQRDNTIASYEKFVKEYPDGPYTEDAKKRLKELREEEAFKEAEAKNSIVTYQAFIQKYPNSKFEKEAGKRTAASDEDAFIRTLHIGTIQAFQGFVESYPTSKYIKEAKDRIRWMDEHGICNTIGLIIDIKEVNRGTKEDKQSAILEILKKDFEGSCGHIELLDNSFKDSKGNAIKDSKGNAIQTIALIEYKEEQANPSAINTEKMGRDISTGISTSMGTGQALGQPPAVSAVSGAIGGLVGGLLTDITFATISSMSTEMSPPGSKLGDSFRIAIRDNEEKALYTGDDISSLPLKLKMADTARWIFESDKSPRESLGLFLRKADLNNDQSVRGFAAFALAGVKDSRTVEPLIAALQKDEEWYVRENAAKALGEIGWKPSNKIEEINYLFAAKKWDELIKIGQPAVELIVGVLKDEDENWSVRENAAKALGEIKDSKTVDPLIKVFQDENWRVRMEVAKALGKIKDPRAVEPLIAALKDEDWRVRMQVANALGEIKDHRAVEPLVMSLEDEKWYVRDDAVYALGKIKDPRAIDPLIEALEDKNSTVRVRAEWALVEVGKPSVEPLITVLKNENADVRWRSVAALRKITGQHFGDNPDKWQKWWEENKKEIRTGR